MPLAKHPAECQRVVSAIVLETQENRYVTDLAIGQRGALLRRQGHGAKPRRQSQHKDLLSHKVEGTALVKPLEPLRALAQGSRGLRPSRACAAPARSISQLSTRFAVRSSYLLAPLTRTPSPGVLVARARLI